MSSFLQPQASPVGRTKLNCRVDGLFSAAEAESQGSRMVVVSSYDLLGLGHDARVREAGQRALKRFSAGWCSETQLQAQFEARAATLFQAESALVIAHESEFLLRLPWWQLAATARSCRANSDATPVASPEEAELALGRDRAQGLYVEAIHVNEGDLAPVPRYAEACQRNHAQLLVVDDGLGVLGPNGAGAVEHLSLQAQVALRLAPLGGAIPGSGALILGAAEMVERWRGLLHAPPPTSLGAALKALEIAHTESTRRERLFDVVQQLLTALKAIGFDTGPCVTPWVPLWLGDESLCEQWLQALAGLGIVCRGWLAGPRSRLLLSPPATLSQAQIDHITSSFERLARKLPFPEAAASHRSVPPLARPGSYAMHTQAAMHWATIEPRPPRGTGTRIAQEETVLAPPVELTVRERIFDAVETLTWKTASRGSAQLRRSADALRAVLDRTRK